MNVFKWLFTSKYKKLLRTIDVCKKTGQSIHLENDTILNFDTNTIEAD
jgi:hypothetical protein